MPPSLSGAFRRFGAVRSGTSRCAHPSGGAFPSTGTLTDASAVQYTRDPLGLRSALEILEAGTTVPQRVSTATAHLWIDHPKPASVVQRGLLAGLMDTHPPIRQRITLLRQMEGLCT